MALACGQCGAELQPGMRFCEECGASTEATDGTGGTSHEGATRTASPQVASAQITERKVTSVLFGDLVSFTTLSERHDKEDVRDLLSRYFAQCRRIVARYGGTIEKFIGDAVMAVWGVPVAHEDDAERAVRAGLELVREIETLGEELGLPGLAMRVGIVTGEVAVTVGAEHEGMVAGDAVNTAARVQSVAEPGEVWVDETTRLLTSGAITYVDVGSHELKGKADPMPLWAVRAVVAAMGGAQRADGLEAPLTGRGRELRVIKELFHGVEESGRPALVLLNGDPGLGKSRLAWEFEKYIDGLSTEVTWHSTRCLAYGDGIAFWPIADAVRGRIGLVEADNDADPGAALDEWLAENVPEESEAAWIRARVLTLLGQVSSGGFERDDLFAAWQAFFERAGQGDPVVLVIDDVQNADEGTISFVEHLLANSEAPLFLLLMSRPGLLQRWPDLAMNRRVTVLHLATLDNREMADLLDDLVAGLPEDVRDGLVQRAQGVPLYAIETVRSLIDRDLVIPRGGVYVLPDSAAVDLASIGAPASLHALVAARLDGLPVAERRVVTDASVLGATFTRDAIAALATDPANLDGVLAALARSEIFSTVTSRLSAEYGQYRFVQDIVRQVAYSTLSRRDRKARHLAVAEYLGTLGDPGGDNAPVIAQHYLDAIEASGEADPDLAALRARAVEQLDRAAQRARSLGAPRDALRYLETALEQHPDDRTAADLHLAAAWAAERAAAVDAIKSHIGAAMSHFEQAGDRLKVGECIAVRAMSLGFYEADNAAALDIALPEWDALQGVPGSEPVLLQLSRSIIASQLNLNRIDERIPVTAIALAEAIDDQVAMGNALIGLSIMMLGRAPSFAQILNRAAVDVARERHLPALAARALNNLALIAAQNDLVEADRVLDEATGETRKAGETGTYQVAVDAVNRSLIALERADWDRCEEILDTVVSDTPLGLIGPWLDAALADARARPLRHPTVSDELRLIDDKGLLSYVAMADMYAAKSRGDLTAAVARGREAVQLAFEVAGLADDQIHIWPSVVECAFAAGDAETIGWLLDLVDGATTLGTGYRAHRSRFAALLAIREGSHADVEQQFRDAITGFERWGAPAYAAKARAELARWLDDQGRVDDAAELRATAVQTLRGVGARGWMAELGLAPVDVPVTSG